MNRRKSLPVRAGTVTIGGNSPVSVQAMTKIATGAVSALLPQARKLQAAGAELIRVSILSEDEVASIPALKRAVSVPVVADIHFRGDLALAAVRAGADKIRINPGNIPRTQLRAILAECRSRRVPIRIGVNSGSVRVRGSVASSMVSCCLDTLKFFEDGGFRSIVISVKSPSVYDTVAACRQIAERCDYPFHLGITEAGRGPVAEAKSAAGIGCLLLEGIGDTIRVSLTAPPEDEVAYGRALLQAVGLRRFFPEIVSCPTCGRTRVDLFSVLGRVERMVRRIAEHHPEASSLTIAVMGCEVNGPGEARQADIGIAGGKGRWALFVKGKVKATYPEKEIVQALENEIVRFLPGVPLRRH